MSNQFCKNNVLIFYLQWLIFSRRKNQNSKWILRSKFYMSDCIPYKIYGLIHIILKPKEAILIIPKKTVHFQLKINLTKACRKSTLIFNTHISLGHNSKSYLYLFNWYGYDPQLQPQELTGKPTDFNGVLEQDSPLSGESIILWLSNLNRNSKSAITS